MYSYDRRGRKVASYQVKKQRAGYVGTTIWLVTDPSQREPAVFGTAPKIVGYVIHASPGRGRGGYTRPEPFTAYVGEPSPSEIGRRYVYRPDERLERPKEVGSFWDEEEIRKLEAAGKLGEGEADKLIKQVGNLGGLDAALKAVERQAH